MKTKIMLVDDDVDYLVTMRMQLENVGFEIQTADTIEGARELLTTSKPALAIVDLMMERVDDGFRLCYEIKKLDASIPVILVTGVAAETGLEFDTATKEERSWIKADVVLDKPIRFEQLHREIQRLLKVQPV